MDGAQIAILAVVAVITLLFIKYKISGSVKKEFQFAGRVLDRGYEIIGAVAMVGAVISVAVVVTMFYSVLAPPAGIAEARVVHKESHYNGPRRGHSYVLLLTGDVRDTDQLVSAKLYNLVNPGDRLRIELSPVFGDWRNVTVASGDRTVAEVDETEYAGMLIMAIMFLLPLVAFPVYFRMRDSRIAGSIVLMLIILLELIPVAIIMVRRG